MNALAIDMLYRNNDWDSIINFCHDKNLNDDEKTLFYYGLALHHRTLFEKSIEILDRLRFESDYFCLAKLYNGLSSISLKDIKLAVNNFSSVIHTNHRHKMDVLESILFNYSSCLDSLQLGEESIKYLKEAIKLSPQNGFYYIALLTKQVKRDQSNIKNYIEVIYTLLPSIPIERIRPLCEFLYENNCEDYSQAIMVKSLSDHEQVIKSNSGF